MALDEAPKSILGRITTPCGDTIEEIGIGPFRGHPVDPD
jgi:hypothetical protein